jgi:orotate phosphoribosyltransferase
MSTFDQDSFNHFVVQNNVYGFFDKPVTLKSGRQSHFYANWRNVVEDAWLTRRLVEYVIGFIEQEQLAVDTFYGVPEGATKLGILTQFTWASRQASFAHGSHVLAMGRAKPKDHGDPKDRYFVGAPRGRVIVLEDVTTTGGSSIATIKFLQDAGIEVTAMISLTNRMELRDDGLSVSQAVANLGVAFHHLSSALDVLPAVYRDKKPSEEVGRAIGAEYEKYGIESIKL